MIFWEIACICVQECCCHPVKETLALLECTSQWLKCSELPAGVKTAVAMQALGEHQGKLRHISTPCPGRTHSLCDVPQAGFKGGCWHLLSVDWQDHLVSVAAHPHCGNATWYPVPWVYEWIPKPWYSPGAEVLPESLKSSYLLSPFSKCVKLILELQSTGTLLALAVARSTPQRGDAGSRNANDHDDPRWWDLLQTLQCNKPEYAVMGTQAGCQQALWCAYAKRSVQDSHSSNTSPECVYWPRSQVQWFSFPWSLLDVFSKFVGCFLEFC